MPAAAPRIAPWWWAGVPSRGAAISSTPSASIPAWKAISAGTAKAEWSPPVRGSVSTSSVRPVAVMITPTHWREPTWQPNSRSPITASITTPVESATWTTRQRRERERGHVESERDGGDRHADREPARAEQVTGAAAAARAARPAGRRGAAVLAQESELRDGRAQQCEPDTDVQVNSLPFVDLRDSFACGGPRVIGPLSNVSWTALSVRTTGGYPYRGGGARTGKTRATPARDARSAANCRQLPPSPGAEPSAERTLRPAWAAGARSTARRRSAAGSRS